MFEFAEGLGCWVFGLDDLRPFRVGLRRWLKISSLENGRLWLRKGFSTASMGVMCLKLSPTLSETLNSPHNHPNCKSRRGSVRLDGLQGRTVPVGGM